VPLVISTVPGRIMSPGSQQYYIIWSNDGVSYPSPLRIQLSVDPVTVRRGARRDIIITNNILNMRTLFVIAVITIIHKRVIPL